MKKLLFELAWLYSWSSTATCVFEHLRYSKVRVSCSSQVEKTTLIFRCNVMLCMCIQFQEEVEDHEGKPPTWAESMKAAAKDLAISEQPAPIIYSSRTHSQLAQVMGELRNTCYK